MSPMVKSMSRGDVVLFKCRISEDQWITIALVTRNSYDPMFNLNSLYVLPNIFVILYTSQRK